MKATTMHHTSNRRLHTEVYRPAQLIPEIHSLGWGRISLAARTLKEHTHHAYEICFIVSGCVNWCAPDGMTEISGGSLYVVRPGELHGGMDSMIHPCELYWLIVEIPHAAPLPGLSVEQTRFLHDRFQAMTLRTFTGSSQVHESFRRLMFELRVRNELAKISARATLHTLLVDVLRHHDDHLQHQRRPNSIANDAIARAVTHIEQQPADDWLVEELAESCGMAVAKFHELFIQHTGLSPAEYRTRKRVRDAKKLLTESKISITRLSHNLGFSSSQYFATVFKNFTGMSPKEYRQRAALTAKTQPI